MRGSQGVLAGAALLLAACSGTRVLEPARVFNCSAAEAGVDSAQTPTAPAALSDLASAVPPVGSAPTADAVEAKRLFQAEHWAPAEALLRKVARGEDGDDKKVRQLAEHDLGIAFYYQGKFEDSLNVFLAISANPEHEKHAEASAWLFRLAQKGPPYLDRAARALSLYALDKPRDLADDAQWQAWWGVLHVVGRYFYRIGRYDAAVQNFGRVPPRSDVYDLARECLAVVCARPAAPAACGRGPR